MVKKQVDEKKDQVYSKEQFMRSKSHNMSKYVLDVLLEDGREYSKDEVQKMYDDYLKRGDK